MTRPAADGEAPQGASSGGAESTAFSVVVPARDAAATLGACLRALSEQLEPVPEVIVVDDGSEDFTRVIAEVWAQEVDPARVGRARVITQPPRGAAAARNTGVRAASGLIVLFTDADCRPLPSWTQALVGALADPTVSAAMGQMGSDQGELVARLAQAEYADKQAATAARGPLAFADTATAAFRASALAAVGGFDESMAAVEDTELAFRLADAGHRMAFVRGAAVLHQHPATWADYARRKFRFGRWGARVYLGHPRRIAGEGRTPTAMRVQLVCGAVVVAASLLAAAAGLVMVVTDRPFGPAGGAVALMGYTAAGALVVLVAAAIPAALRSMRLGYGPMVALGMPLLAVVRTFALLAGLAVGIAERVLGRPLLPEAPRRPREAAFQAGGWGEDDAG